jgi:hypothetical protein
MEGRLIFLHRLRRLNASGRWPERNRPASRGRLRKERGRIRFRSSWKDSQEKPMPDKADARTKTDTGRREEYSQALERTLVKELGKLTP